MFVSLMKRFLVVLPIQRHWWLSMLLLTLFGAYLGLALQFLPLVSVFTTALIAVGVVAAIFTAFALLNIYLKLYYFLQTRQYWSTSFASEHGLVILYILFVSFSFLILVVAPSCALLFSVVYYFTPFLSTILFPALPIWGWGLMAVGLGYALVVMSTAIYQWCLNISFQINFPLGDNRDNHRERDLPVLRVWVEEGAEIDTRNFFHHKYKDTNQYLPDAL